mmetsp:Transcript_1411/g.3303  ORF Transcript_1411/g.3303 Transcript_1411/m.3303 type:complete len:683 (-) Transcript_1411:185-2233(-)
MKRSNLWDRFKSLLTAQATNVWHARSSADLKGIEVLIDVPIEKMLNGLAFMKKVDDYGDDWARAHSSDLLFIDYQECRVSPQECKAKMLEFLGVDPVKVSSDAGSIAAFKHTDPLQGISNKEEVTEALAANGWGGFIGVDEYSELQLLMFETEPNNRDAARYLKQFTDMAGGGINATVIGNGTEFKGFGSKYAAALPVLKSLPPDALVVLSDSRDVLLNIHSVRALKYQNLYPSLVRFRKTFADLTNSSPGSIVVSTESQCCVAALGHIRPGDLFEPDGSRSGHICTPGSPNCYHNEHTWSEESAKPWHDFMEQRAKEHGKESSPDIYLNAGLMAGRVKDLSSVIESLRLKEDEDDQAALTAFMYRNPNSIILDYGQDLFGTNRWAEGMEGGCMFDLPFVTGDTDDTSVIGRRLVHNETQTSPLFIHSPGNFKKCHMSLFDKLRTRTRRGLVPEIKTKSVSNVVDPSVEDSNDDEGEGEDIRGNMHGRALKKKCGKGKKKGKTNKDCDPTAQPTKQPTPAPTNVPTPAPTPRNAVAVNVQLCYAGCNNFEEVDKKSLFQEVIGPKISNDAIVRVAAYASDTCEPCTIVVDNGLLLEETVTEKSNIIFEIEVPPNESPLIVEEVTQKLNAAIAESNVVLKELTEIQSNFVESTLAPTFAPTPTPPPVTYRLLVSRGGRKMDDY